MQKVFCTVIFLSSVASKFCIVKNTLNGVPGSRPAPHQTKKFIPTNQKTAANRINTGTNKMKNVRNYKTNGQQYAYILDDVLTGEWYENLTDKEKVEEMFAQFNSERNSIYDKRVYPSLPARLGSWLSGLPTGVEIDYWDDNIINHLQNWGIKISRRADGELTARSWRIVNNWFVEIGNKCVQLARLLNVDINYVY